MTNLTIIPFDRYHHMYLIDQIKALDDTIFAHSSAQWSSAIGSQAPYEHADGYTCDSDGVSRKLFIIMHDDDFAGYIQVDDGTNIDTVHLTKFAIAGWCTERDIAPVVLQKLEDILSSTYKLMYLDIVCADNDDSLFFREAGFRPYSTRMVKQLCPTSTKIDDSRIYTRDEIINAITERQANMRDNPNATIFIAHHECGICNAPIGYVIRPDAIYFDSSCGCARSIPRIATADDIVKLYDSQTMKSGRDHITRNLRMDPIK